MLRPLIWIRYTITGLVRILTLGFEVFAYILRQVETTGAGSDFCGQHTGSSMLVTVSSLLLVKVVQRSDQYHIDRSHRSHTGISIWQRPIDNQPG